METNAPVKKIKTATAVYAIILLVLAYILAAGIAITIFNYSGALTRPAEKLIPYPAAVINGNIIRISELKDRLSSVQSFYENQDFSDLGVRVDFSTGDGKKRLKIKEKEVLEKMIEDAVVEKEAHSLGITITGEMVSQEVKRKMDEYGSEQAVRENLSRLYGWSIEDFEKRVVEPDLYKEKLWENLKESDESYHKAKEKIASAQDRIKKGGDFARVAKELSEGESSKNDGDLGWFSSDQMLPEIAVVAYVMEKGKTSDIIESSLGFHIIKVEDRKQEDEKDLVRIRQIFVRTKNLGNWLDEWLKEARIRIILRDYRWNSDIERVEFTQSEMRDFEANLEENSPNDISVMF